MTIENEVKKAIEKNLPAEVGKVLQERLARAEKDAVELGELGRKYTAQSNELANLLRDLTQARDMLAKHELLAKREADVLLREKLIELREKNASDQVGNVMNLVDKLFTSRKVESLFSFNAGGSIPVSANGYPQSQPFSVNVSGSEEKKS